MSKPLQLIRRATQLLTLVALCACGPQSRSQEPAMPKNELVIQRATAAVEEYIVKSKGWDKSRFEVTFNREEGTALVFLVLHDDDKAKTIPGGGKSVEVYVDPLNDKVVKELAFQ